MLSPKDFSVKNLGEPSSAHSELWTVSDRVKTGNRLWTDQPGMPLSISALVGNFFTNINSR